MQTPHSKMAAISTRAKFNETKNVFSTTERCMQRRQKFPIPFLNMRYIHEEFSFHVICFQVFMFSVFIWYAVTHAIWDLSVWNSTVSLNNSKCSKLTDSEDELQRTESRKYKSGHVLMTLQVSQMCSRQKAGRENTYFCIFGTGKIVRNGDLGK